MKKRSWVTITIIVAVIILAIVLINASKNGVSKETAMCIANNSILYVQFGCHACEIQEEMFGENYQYLNVIDCWFERERCEGITFTPTWLINNEKYDEVQTIEKLKELTGCT